eukprot:m.338379 g.338379  ORF g.338379 m.338379 type:complete len:349 (+) comp18398_c0_seq1:56-1102(+)
MSEPPSKKQKEGQTFLITGGQGFFGVYIAKQLLEEGATPIIFDLSENNSILEQVLEKDQVTSIKRIYGDITNGKLVTEMVLEHKPTGIIHLAGLQIPTCKARPVLGANVNIIGTINVFEAALALKKESGTAPAVVYASSAAVLGPKGDYENTPVPDEQPHKPRTLYGVYKLCTEGIARIYHQDHALASVGLRPYTCFGVGREVGLTSDPTKAIKATVLGKKFEIKFSGVTGFSYIVDIARIFIGCCRAKNDAAVALNIRGVADTVENFVKIMNDVLPASKDLITITGNELTIMADVDETKLQALLDTVPEPYAVKKPFPMPLADCIKDTAEFFTSLHKAGRLHDRDLQ